MEHLDSVLQIFGQFNVNDEYSDNDLHDNINNGNLQYIVNYLRDAGDPSRIIFNKLNEFSLLMWAVYFNQKSIAHLLITHGADLEFEKWDGCTAVGYAAKYYKVSIDILKMLLDAGANPNYYSKKAELNRGNSNTPLGFCIQYGEDQENFIDKLKLLLEYGANPNIKDGYEVNALHKAVDELRPPVLSDVIKMLLIYGADIDSVNGDGDSILFRARLNYSSDALVTLLEWGADPWIKSKRGWNAFLDAYFKGGMRDHKKIFYEKIDNLHKTNVAYQMLEFSKGLYEEEPIVDEVNLLENIYLDLLEEPYNPLLTRERKQEDLKDMEAYGKYVSRVKVGGRKRTLRKRIKLQ